MENVIAVTRRPVKDSDLQKWVSAKGGYWLNDGLRQGVVERGNGAVYVSIYEDYFAELEPEELLQLERQIGEQPATAVSFTISRSPNSEALADELVAAFCADCGAVRVRD